MSDTTGRADYSATMASTKRRIEVDDATATARESRAAEQGLSVSELVAELALNSILRRARISRDDFIKIVSR